MPLDRLSSRLSTAERTKKFPRVIPNLVPNYRNRGADEPSIDISKGTIVKDQRKVDVLSTSIQGTEAEAGDKDNVEAVN